MAKRIPHTERSFLDSGAISEMSDEATLSIAMMLVDQQIHASDARHRIGAILRAENALRGAEQTFVRALSLAQEVVKPEVY